MMSSSETVIIFMEKMDMAGDIVTLKLTTECNSSDDSDTRYITEYNGIMVIHEYDKEGNYEEIEVGYMRAFLINLEAAQSEGVSLWELFDYHGDVAEFSGTILDDGSEDFDEDLLWEYGLDQICHLLILDRIEIDPKYRGRGIGLAATNLMVERVGYGCDLIALKAFPLQFEVKSRNDTPGADDAKGKYNDFPEDEERALKQLMSYYAKAGFKPFKSDRIMLRQSPSSDVNNFEEKI